MKAWRRPATISDFRRNPARVQWATETDGRREQDDLERRAERHERAIETAARLEELGPPRLSIKVLFLDIDGVLVNRWSLMQASGCQAPFAPACLTALNRILRETTAQIVVTSVWRTEFSELRRSSLQHLLTVKGVAGTVLDSTRYCAARHAWTRSRNGWTNTNAIPSGPSSSWMTKAEWVRYQRTWSRPGTKSASPSTMPTAPSTFSARTGRKDTYERS